MRRGSSPRRTGLRLAALLSLLGGGLRCASVEERVPVVPQDRSLTSEESVEHWERLRAGREIYLSRRCTGCHGPYAVTALDAGHFADMAERANLDDTQREALRSYVTWATHGR